MPTYLVRAADRETGEETTLRMRAGSVSAAGCRAGDLGLDVVDVRRATSRFVFHPAFVMAVLVGVAACAMALNWTPLRVAIMDDPGKLRHAETDGTVFVGESALTIGTRFENLPQAERDNILNAAHRYYFGDRPDAIMVVRHSRGIGEWATYSRAHGWTDNPRRFATCKHKLAAMVIPAEPFIAECAETSPTVAAMLEQKRRTGFAFWDPCVLERVADSEPGAAALLERIRFVGE